MPLSLILVSASNCSVKYAPKKVETCIHNEDNSAECNDMRKPESEQSYERTNLTNYICTNTVDYNYLYDYANDLRQKLIRCENQLREE